MDSTAEVIGALGGLGIAAYNISQGAPVSTTTVGGVTSIQTGAAVSQTSIFLILGIIAAAVVAFLILR